MLLDYLADDLAHIGAMGNICGKNSKACTVISIKLWS